MQSTVAENQRHWRRSFRLLAGMGIAAMMGLGSGVMLAQAESAANAPDSTAAVTDPTERVECNVVAVIVSGRRVPGFEATARGPDGAEACRKAMRQCRTMLDQARSSTGLALPSAECQPLETTQLIPDPIEPPAEVVERAGRGTQPATAEADPSCNVTVCSRRYRSFRASDCTFQPYNGPRRRCRF